MRLSTVAISIIKGNRAIWDAIRKVLGVSTASMYRYVSLNDSKLTEAAVLKVLREETGLTDSELLEEEVPAKA